MLEICNAEYIEDYRIELTFSDGVIGIVDLNGDLWGPVFEPLKNKEYFKHFKLSKTFGTIVWDNEADFAPEFLYSKLQK